MNKNEAEKVLNHNKLILNCCGLDFLNLPLTQVDAIPIHNDKDWYAILHGVEWKNKKKGVTELSCFWIEVPYHHIFYYRDHFSEAMEVIQALRVVNNYK